jgi:hypothetical protein
MGVKGLTLFHLKSHLQVLWHVLACSSKLLKITGSKSFPCDQKYRLGKQSGKEGSEQSKDGK